MNKFFSFLFIFSFFFSSRCYSVKYKTTFGDCPSRSAGNLALSLIKVFEAKGSLIDVKKELVEKKLSRKHFISDYKIAFDPATNMLKFNFVCPKALMKVQIYKEDGIDSYEAILVDNGELYDPTYQVLLEAEKKKKLMLPYFAIPVGRLDDEVRKEVASIISSMDERLRSKVSEVILNDEKELTIIMSFKGSPSSVFLGKESWQEKSKKLWKIVNYMQKKKQMPVVINLVNLEKVVVKFNDKL